MATFHWTFGDGATADGQEVQHTYWLPGQYTWTCKVYDSEIPTYTIINGEHILVNIGKEFNFTGTIYVYDWTYGLEDGLNVSYTNRCLRYSFKPSQGLGWALVGGDSFPFPEARVGTLKILDVYDEERLLVLDTKTCVIHEIEVRDIFQDGVTEYGGTDIDTEIKFKEEHGSAEHYFLKSLEHHAEFRPQDEDNQGKAGYTAAGYRNAFEVDYVLRKDGTQTIDTLKAQKIPLEGDVTFKYDDEAHRWQPIIRTTTSEFKIVRMRNYYERLDKPSGPTDRMMSEHGYGLELMASSVNLDRQPLAVNDWVTDGAHTMPINFATGNAFTGMYFGFTTGPDKKANSALSFVAALDGLYTQETVALSGDFTVMFWAKGCIGDIIAQNTGFTIDLTVTDLTYSEAGGPNTSLPVDWNINEWNLYTVIRANGLLRIYVNKTLKRSIDWTPVSFSGIFNVMNLSVGEVFVARVYPTAITADAIGFHYDDVTQKYGKATCRMF